MACTREAPCNGVLRQVLLASTFKIEECWNGHRFRCAPHMMSFTWMRSVMGLFQASAFSFMSLPITWSTSGMAAKLSAPTCSGSRSRGRAGSR